MDSTWLHLEFFSVAPPSSPLGIIGDGNAVLGSRQPRTVAAPTSALFVEKARDKHDLNESNHFYQDELLQPAQPAENSVDAQDYDGQDVFQEFFTNSQDQQIAGTFTANESLDSSPEPIPIANELTWMETAMPLDSASGGSEQSAIDNIVNEIRSEAQRLEDESNASSDSSECGGDSIAYTVIEDVPLDESIDDALPSVTSIESDSSSTTSGRPRPPTARRKRPLNKDEKRERKKAQNVTAARRYRQKKMAEAMDVHGTLDRLGKRNLQLKASIRTTQAEIEIMKRLLRDVRADLDL